MTSSLSLAGVHIWRARLVPATAAGVVDRYAEILSGGWAWTFIAPWKSMSNGTLLAALQRASAIRPPLGSARRAVAVDLGPFQERVVLDHHLELIVADEVVVAAVVLARTRVRGWWR